MRPLCLLSLSAAGLALSGCATAIPPVEVTRFHRIDSAIVAGSSYRLQSGAASGDQTALADRDFASAIARQLDRLGLVTADATGDSAYVVEFSVDRAERPDDGRGSGINVGVGGGTGGYRSGVGVGVGLDLTRLLAGNRDAVATRLSIRMTRQGGSLAVWEGRAESVARVGTPGAQTGFVADKLATALFADFPGRSGETISVP